MKNKLLRRSILLLLVLLPISLSDCKKKEEPPKEKDFYVVDVKQDTNWDYWVVGKEGVSYCINLENPKMPYLYYKPSKTQTGYPIFLDEYGRPSKVYINNYTFIFDNYTKNTVDIASISPDGTIKVFRNKSIAYDFTSVSTKGTQISSKLSDWFSTVGKAISVASCEIGIITAEATIGIGTAIGCGLLVLDLYLASLPTENEVLGLSVKTASAAKTAVGCIESAPGCAAGLLSEGFAVASAATQSINTHSTWVNAATVQLIMGMTVTTTPITVFSSNSATVGGDISSDGTTTITDKGVYWGTSQNPETTGTKLQIGSGIGAFSTSLSLLNPNTIYYVKAYAINSVGTAIGNPVSFKTAVNVNNPPSIPSNPSPSNGVTGISTSPTLTWTCTDPENDPLTYDIYLGTTNNPTTIVGSNLTTLSYSPSVLNAGVTYYWKVVVRDSHSNSTSGPVWSFTTAQNGTIPINGLVAYYPFNGNANDESGNGNNGTVNGATLIADRKGNPNSAFSFNGTSNYITVQNSTSLQLTTLASFNIWVLVPSGLSFDTRPAVGPHFFCKGATYGDKWANYSIQLTGQNGVIAFELNSTTGGQYNGVSTTNPFGRDSWHMITVVYVGGQVKFYIDGILTDTKTNSITSLATSSLPLYIGVRYTSVYTGGYTGKLDDFRIYNRALTDQEISALYNE